MKKINEINWSLKYRSMKEKEYEAWSGAKAIALSNGDSVSQKMIDTMDELQIAVWEGKITKKEMEKIVSSFRPEGR